MCTFFDIWTSQSGPNPYLFTLLTWKCASHHNGIHFFHIWMSKSGLNPSIFYTFDIPLGISSKECDNPGCRKKLVFAKIGGLCAWLTRTPPFFAKASWVTIFRESILRGYRHALWCASSHCGLLYVFMYVDRFQDNMDLPISSDLHMYLYLTWICCIFWIWFPGQWFLEGLRPQHTPCLHSLDVPFQ